jgi:uncharacterized protein (TIGR02996 family)
MPEKPEPAFPNPAAVLPGEADVLANVLADLSNDNAKLVYADWLEDRDDPRGPLLRDCIAAYRAGNVFPAAAPPRPWRNLVGLTLMDRLRGTALESRTDQLLALARPALSFKSTIVTENELAVGASKFGGRPDLPRGAAWPRFRGRPLAFLGQFNLGDLRRSPVSQELPDGGLLSVFCAYEEGSGNDAFDDGAWGLLYSPDSTALERHEPDADRGGALFRPCGLEFTEILTLPSRYSPWGDELARLLADEDDSANEEYRILYYELWKDHVLLGYPFPIQGDVLGAKSVRHLLTISRDDNTGWEWGDGGSLYFTLAETDLKQGRFERVEVVVDCA